MKLIAKIALPLAIVAALAGCSSSSSTPESTDSMKSSIACPFTAEQMKEDSKDQVQIAGIREALRTGKPSADMIQEKISLSEAQMLINIYDETMKSCK